MTPPSPSREEQIETLLREYPPQHKPTCAMRDCWCGTDEAHAKGLTTFPRYDVVCPKHDTRECTCGLSGLLAALRSSVPPLNRDALRHSLRLAGWTDALIDDLFRGASEPAPPVEKD